MSGGTGSTRCDRCRKRRGWLRVERDWRLFCGRCFLAAAWEPRA